MACFSMKLIPAFMLVAFSGAANASGFQLLEQNASGIGNAFAGSAAVAENASTVYYNPAGMTQLQDHEISAGIAAVGPSFKFHNNGSSVGALGTAGDGGDAGGWAALPNGYASWALNKDLYLGVGVGAPFGLKTEYDAPWIGAAHSTSFEIKTININPSIAYRVNDKVSLGFGVNWQKIEAEYIRQVGASVPLTSTMNLDDSAWGWNAGALFTLSPAMKVGISYRSEVKYNTEGDVKLSNGARFDSEADLTVPGTFIMSVTQKLNDKWDMLGDVSWTGWSSIPKVDIMNATTGSATPLQTLETDFRDAWRVALGSNYTLNDAWKLKFGLAYDQTPVQGASTRLTALPDNDRVWFSFGTQWTPSKASRFDLGVSYIYVQDSKINNDQSSAVPSRGRVTGEYEGDIWVLGGQYSQAF